MYTQSYGNLTQQSSQQSNPVQEQDWGNLLLSELKRTAREYTTAALEATHPAIRQTFQSLAQKSMQEQAELFDVLSQLNGYGSIKMANPQEIQQELQQQVQKAEQLQNLVQQAIQGAHAQAAQAQAIPYQQQQQQQYPANTALHATSYPSSQASVGQSFGQQGQGYAQPSYMPSGQTYSGSQVGSSFNQAYGSGTHSSSAGSTMSSSFGYGSGSGSTTVGTSPNLARSATTQQSYGSSTASNGAQEGYTAVTESRGGNSYNWNPSIGASSTRGGNSFDWNASDDSDTSAVSSASSAKTTGHNTKYML